MRAALPTLDRLAFWAVLGLPPALMHGRAVADILLSATDLLFLLAAARGGGWAWTRAPFARAAGAWWAWQLLCSLLAWTGVGQALVAIRLPLLVPATLWALAGPGRPALLLRVLAASALWIAVQSWQQLLTGRNLFGDLRWIDGALTGPFNRPRAGPALVLLLFPVLLPLAAGIARRLPGWRGTALAAGIAACAGATQLIIGQRMPLLLMAAGFLAGALLLPRLRPAALAAMAVAVLAGAAVPVLIPATAEKLIYRTERQATNFVLNPYGQLFVRGTVIALDHPLRGTGVGGFRKLCAEPRYARGLPALGIPDALARAGPAACNVHPHNIYLEAATTGGLPLVILLAVMAGTLLRAIAAGLGRPPDALALGCLIAAGLFFFPLATASALLSLPNAGWCFLLAGLGLAATARTGGSQTGSRPGGGQTGARPGAGVAPRPAPAAYPARPSGDALPT